MFYNWVKLKMEVDKSSSDGSSESDAGEDESLQKEIQNIQNKVYSYNTNIIATEFVRSLMKIPICVVW